MLFGFVVGGKKRRKESKILSASRPYSHLHTYIYTTSLCAHLSFLPPVKIKPNHFFEIFTFVHTETCQFLNGEEAHSNQYQNYLGRTFQEAIKVTNGFLFA